MENGFVDRGQRVFIIIYFYCFFFSFLFICCLDGHHQSALL
jgi:hypothetical protein